MTAPEIYERRRQQEYNEAYRKGAYDRKKQQPYNPPGLGCLLQQAAYCAGFYDEENTMLKITFEDLTIPEIKLLADDFGMNVQWIGAEWAFFVEDIDIRQIEEICEKTGMVCPVSVSSLYEDRFEVSFQREEQCHDQSVQAAA